MSTIEQLRQLELALQQEQLPHAEYEWAGADVVITSETPAASTGEPFYPDPRYVITAYSYELSRLFEHLRDAFYAENRVDGCTKIEFFGRLANAANRCLLREPSASAQLLCAAVLHEAFAIYDEMEEGSFEYFWVAVGNEIADDYVDEALRSGFMTAEETLAFFASHGVEVGHE